MTIVPEAIKLKVGFEIHQQLSTKSKLFCNCRCEESRNYETIFMRKLRPTHSELGTFDPAALFEYKKMRMIKYHASAGSSCLVEADEEPPQEMNKEALETALIFSLALHSRVADEIHTMRKIVIDGSNTSGFQRTMLVAHGGYIDVNGEKVNIQSICLEEDAAKLLSDDGSIREYGLDRLGIPLVEIALEPITGGPEELMQVALSMGRLLRSSKRVARGLGSIRQDVNISVNDGGVVEVKGVQQLDQLIRVIKYEMLRQHGLILIAQKLKNERRVNDNGVGDRIEDVTDILRNSSSKIVQRSLACGEDVDDDNSKGVFKAIRVKGFAGMIRFEPYPEIRIGKQLSELVRFYGLGGIFHSDELPNYGISEEEVIAISKRLGMAADVDAFVIIGGVRDKVEFAVESIIRRLKMALIGVPSETRSATLEGKTIFSRPRPGAARMYPETDIPPIQINNSVIESLIDKVPKSWDENVNTLARKYSLNRKHAEQIFDSNYLGIFEEIASLTKVQPTFIVSKLTEDLINLERQGLDTTVLTDEIIIDVFRRLDAGTIAKESIALIFEKILRKESITIDQAIEALGITTISDQEMEMTIDKVLEENMPVIRAKGMASLGMLMGRSMSVLRGKIDGQKINSTLRKKLEELLMSATFTTTNNNYQQIEKNRE
ncbi:MAG TPA: Glu-tRNA(Gln) amidotransferase subunit GatE [Nitrososphaeraceae archaeon]|nr:Glu-tRNA(Gln) amidotransferase subunit GatE [Nitrososphaeraceae archaeon]